MKNTQYKFWKSLSRKFACFKILSYVEVFANNSSVTDSIAGTRLV